jgi:hypothetical protein
MQFLDISETPYALAHVQHQPVEEPEVNPSASLNEWLVFPDSQEMEVHFLCDSSAIFIHKFCFFTLFFLLHYVYSLATLENLISSIFPSHPIIMLLSCHFFAIFVMAFCLNYIFLLLLFPFLAATLFYTLCYIIATSMILTCAFLLLPCKKHFHFCSFHFCHICDIFCC